MGEVTVVVAAGHLHRIDAVVRALQARGMRVGAVHRALGLVSGFAPAHLCPGLRGVEGVEDVSCATAFEVAPPDSAVQAQPE